VSPFGRLAAPNTIDSGQFHKKYCMRRSDLIPAILAAERSGQSPLPEPRHMLARSQVGIPEPLRRQYSVLTFLLQNR
jgi:hypothetical protein